MSEVYMEGTIQRIKKVVKREPNEPQKTSWKVKVESQVGNAWFSAKTKTEPDVSEGETVQFLIQSDQETLTDEGGE